MRAFRLLFVRRLRQQPLRAVIAIVAVAAGVALGVAILVTRSSVEVSVRDFGRSLAGPAELRIVGPTPRAGLELATVEAAGAVEGVAAVVPMVQVASQVDFLPTDGRTLGPDDIESASVLVLGVDCRVENLLGLSGCDPALLGTAGEGALVVGPGLAAPAGTEASMRTDSGRLSIAGAPVGDGLATINEGRVVVLALDVAQRRFLQEGFVDIAYVLPAEGADVDAVRDRLQAAFGDHVAVLGVDDPPAATELVLQAFLPLFSLLGLFGLGTGAVLVRNTVSLSLEERRRQLAITAAVGGDRRTLVGGAVGEAALLGLFGGLLGSAGGVAVAGPIVGGLSDFTESVAGVQLTRHVPASVVVIGALLGALVGALAAIGPARRAARLDVAAELSGRSIVSDAKPVRLVRRLVVWSAVAAIGAVGCWSSQVDGGIEPWQASIGPPSFLVVTVSLLLVTSALVPLAIGRVARAAGGTRRATWLLSLAELVRDPRRVGILAVAIGSPVVTGFATDGFVSSAREGIGNSFERDDPAVSVSTIAVNEGEDAFLSPAAEAQIAALPGVADIVHGTFVPVGRDVSDLLGVISISDFEVDGDDFIRGTPDQSGFDHGEVLIGTSLARREEVRPGDRLPLATPAGIVEVPIQGIIKDAGANGYGVHMHEERFTELFGARPPSWIAVEPVEGLTDVELAATIAASAAAIDPELRVLTRDELVDDIVASIDEQMLPFRVMQQTLVIVAFVAVISTLLLAGLQRRREHGLLAAVGADPGSLRRVVLAEAGVVSVAAVIGAGLAGPITLWTMLQVIPLLIGARNPFQADWAAYVGGAFFAVVVALLAAAWPAWRASRVEVLEALRYE